MLKTIYIDVDDMILDEIEKQASAMNLATCNYVKLVLSEWMECTEKDNTLMEQ